MGWNLNLPNVREFLKKKIQLPWILLIKFMIGLTMNMRERSIVSLYSENTQ